MKKVMNFVMIVIILITIFACGSENEPQKRQSTEPTVSQSEFDEQRNRYEEQLAQYQRADSARNAEYKVNQEVEDSLSAINITPLGILPIWNGKKIRDAVTPGTYGLDGIHSTMTTLFSETGFGYILKSFITNPALWQKTFSEPRTRIIIAWFKEKSKVSIDMAILPYLKDEYSANGFRKEYIPEFKKFYVIHSKSDIDGVWYHPKWQQFEEDFFKKFPNAYEGSRPTFGNAYKLWLQTTRLSAPAKKALGSILEICNNPGNYGQTLAGALPISGKSFFYYSRCRLDSLLP